MFSYPMHQRNYTDLSSLNKTHCNLYTCGYSNRELNATIYLECKDAIANPHGITLIIKRVYNWEMITAPAETERESLAEGM